MPMKWLQKLKSKSHNRKSKKLEDPKDKNKGKKFWRFHRSYKQSRSTLPKGSNINSASKEPNDGYANPGLKPVHNESWKYNDASLPDSFIKLSVDQSYDNPIAYVNAEEFISGSASSIPSKQVVNGVDSNLWQEDESFLKKTGLTSSETIEASFSGVENHSHHNSMQFKPSSSNKHVSEFETANSENSVPVMKPEFEKNAHLLMMKKEIVNTEPNDNSPPNPIHISLSAHDKENLFHVEHSSGAKKANVSDSSTLSGCEKEPERSMSFGEILADWKSRSGVKTSVKEIKPGSDFTANAIIPKSSSYSPASYSADRNNSLQINKHSDAEVTLVPENELKSIMDSKDSNNMQSEVNLKPESGFGSDDESSTSSTSLESSESSTSSSSSSSSSSSDSSSDSESSNWSSDSSSTSTSDSCSGSVSNTNFDTSTSKQKPCVINRDSEENDHLNKHSRSHNIREERF